ncbi:MAG: 4a-hydroxytetrahydrobiopterin dehydratase [Candidatus Caenarcaniphilales bacterium]|nr:4a-hydroxytetrahydrobiopterin dehydratase [Candidatus Caenarcaniphilales bacterium]
MKDKLHPKWDIIEEGNHKKLIRKFDFNSYMEAVSFLNKVAEIAEEIDHHPDMLLKWASLDISTWTHSEKKITDLDYDLATRIDTLAS